MSHSPVDHVAEGVGVPEHVDPATVFDFDIYDFCPPGSDPHQVLRDLQAKAPDVIWTPKNGGHWVALRAEASEEAFRNWEVFSSRSVTIPPGATPSLPLETDPPVHTPLRAAISPLFAPSTLKAVDGLARILSRELIDGFILDGRCDFTTQFAQHLPIRMFLHLVDLPVEDAPGLMVHAEVRVRSPSVSERAAAKEAVIAYLQDIIAERRARPGDDFISRILSADMGGRVMNDFEANNLLSTLMVGGLDTVASTLGFAMRFLAGSPEHRHQLVEDPSLIPTAVNELIRRHGVSSGGRILAQDVVFHGVQMRAGDRIWLPATMAGLDDSRFADPMKVDFKRPGASANGAFGGGPHRCPGANLARTELAVVLSEWLPRIPDFWIEDESEVRIQTGLVTTVSKLPLAWDVASLPHPQA